MTYEKRLTRFSFVVKIDVLKKLCMKKLVHVYEIIHYFLFVS